MGCRVDANDKTLSSFDTSNLCSFVNRTLPASFNSHDASSCFIFFTKVELETNVKSLTNILQKNLKVEQKINNQAKASHSCACTYKLTYMPDHKYNICNCS